METADSNIMLPPGPFPCAQLFEGHAFVFYTFSWGKASIGAEKTQRVNLPILKKPGMWINKMPSCVPSFRVINNSQS